MKTYVYRFDEIDYSLNIGSQDPNMFDKGKRTIFNCEVPWSKWKRPPKIGDTITMLNAAPDGYPWKIVQIKINGEIVYDEIKNNFIIPIDACKQLNISGHTLEALSNHGYINKQYDKQINGRYVDFCYLKDEIDILEGLDYTALIRFSSHDAYRDNLKLWEERRLKLNSLHDI